ncbi:MAG: FKBP-type peptidyl-prolyl cis-trans isomerase [Actinomycetaceae bacterium]|nr:FKBP-type peptidyl-prolyl cis-trans isomerase [Actinomycetaceae bacterium]
MNSRILIALVIPALSLGALVGCSSGEDPTGTESPTSTQSETSSAVPVDRQYTGYIPEVEGEFGRSAKILPANGDEPADTVVAHTLKQGDGAEVTAQDIVSAHYVGALWNGEVFDSSFARSSGENPQPTSFSLQQVIDGWTYGLEGQHVGDRVELIIPAQWGYGDQDHGDAIPANSTLVFVVDIVAAINPGDYSALESAEPTNETLPDGLTVTGKLGEKPTVTFDPDVAAPTDDTVIVIARGTGETVKESDTALIHATIGQWGKTDSVNSSWDMGPAQSSGRPIGDTPGVTGLPVGSRAFVVLRGTGSDVPQIAIIDLVGVMPASE